MEQEAGIVMILSHHNEIGREKCGVIGTLLYFLNVSYFVLKNAHFVFTPNKREYFFFPRASILTLICRHSSAVKSYNITRNYRRVGGGKQKHDKR